MDEAAIKELLSVNYARVLAEFEGFITTKPSVDRGDDLYVQEVGEYKRAGHLEYYTAGSMLCLQLKCTTEKSVKYAGDKLHYRLRVKNFDHLVMRRKMWAEKSRMPLVLFLLVLPKDPKKWLVLDAAKGELTLAGKAWWYVPSPEDKLSLQKSAQPISIPIENQVDLQSFSKIFQFCFSNSKRT